jgi:two-component system, chemotaxis family, CheB/CheR fusion protein
VTNLTDDLPLPEPLADPPAELSLVVGLGASAGGIEALTQFFSHAPKNTSIAYVVILHLSPDHESRLAEVLQRTTDLKVAQVRDKVRLEPNHVYVIPPSASLRVVDHSLVVSPQTRFEERKAPIDIFFRTLADTYGSIAAAVVLSGTGADGSSGIKRVKEYGGLTIAQRPEEAQHGEMPANAIATALVDYVLPVAEMPRRIVEYLQRASRTPEEETQGPSLKEDADALRDILTLLRGQTGHDFSDYKPATVRRRVVRRMNLHALQGLQDYVRYMRDHQEEPPALMKELLISVTNFFRDEPAFRALEERVIPKLFEGKGVNDQIRVWSAGCATGEEAYSLAMLLAEHAVNMFERPAIQVFATDLDEAAIAVARDGVYTDADVAEVSPERLKRFFHRDPAGFRVRRELREMVLFAHHNVIKDPPFSHLDLIACRNLLIYLNRRSQDRVMETFHFALRPEGYLVVGTSEVADGTGMFVAVDAPAHIYQARGAGLRPHQISTIESPHAVTHPPAGREARPAERIGAGDLHLRLLEQFGPPSLVVGDDYSVIHMSEHAGQFLRVTGGEPSRDVLKLVRPELQVDLRTALLRAGQERTPIEVRGARVSRTDGDALITVIVKPVLREGVPPRGYFVVLFQEEQAPPSDTATRLETRTEGSSEQLQDEVADLKAQMRVSIEQSETQVEEVKAANEELQAMNEELRASAEELETSKEELQSANEELATVNEELKIKLDELALSNNDFRNLIKSTEIGAIFLDKHLRVKLSTPRADLIFNLLPSDAGRKLSDITNQLLYAELYDDAQQVLGDLQTREREVGTPDGRWFVVRIVPYRTADDRIEGVAITLQESTSRRHAEEHVRASEERLRLLIESAIDYAIFTIGGDGRVASWNPGAERVFGYAPDEIIGADFAVLFTPEDRAAGVPQQELDRAAITGRAEDERWHLRKGGERFYSSGVTTRLGQHEPVGFAKIARDLTERQQNEMALARARAELEDRVRQRTAELRAEVEQHEAARQQVTELLRKVVTAQEGERARIARDLHDQLGQQLTTLRLALENHRQHAGTTATEEIDRALALVRDVDREVDFLAWELRPAALDDLGLVAALPRFLEQWSEHYGIEGRFRLTGNVTGLTPEAEVTFYRVAQEALNNVMKHAHATRVDVLLENRDGSVTLVIEDDGVGFDPADASIDARGIGLMGMRERAALIGGNAQVESSPGKGTTVFLRCPVRDCETR